MIKQVRIKTKDNVNHVMSIDTYSRWLCLAEALLHINEAARKKGVNLNKSRKWIKPLHLQHYINQRQPAMIHDLKIEESLD